MNEPSVGERYGKNKFSIRDAALWNVISTAIETRFITCDVNYRSWEEPEV